MLCAVLKDVLDFADLEEKMQRAAQVANFIELRLDGILQTICIEDLAALKRPCPLIFTLRPKSAGGDFEGSEEKRFSCIQKLLTLQPDFFDIEYESSPSFFEFVKKKTSLIVSFHDFEAQQSTAKIWLKIRKIEAPFYKIARYCSSALRALEDFLWLQEQKKSLPCHIFVSMGERASFSRLMSNFSYLAVDEKSAAYGQFSLDSIQDYLPDNYLPKKTSAKLLQEQKYPKSFFALLGDPVSQSISHQTHNRFLRKLKSPALYLKILVKEEELASFLCLAKKIDFLGFSVTMPLKEKILPLLDFVDETAQKIGSVNTVCRKDSLFKGYNTDGVAALDAIEEHLKVAGKTLLLIGAGGAARAIAYEAKLRGALVFVQNRDVQRAKLLSEEFGLQNKPQKNYSIVVNATPNHMPYKLPLKPELVMDINIQKTEFLEQAERLGCICLDGKEMFFRQAALQFALFLGGCSKTYLKILKPGF